MRKKSVLTRLGIVPVLALFLVTTACGPIEVTARDGIAGAKGFLDSQAALHGECNADPTIKVCALIIKGNAAKHVAIDSLEQFCAGPAFENGTGACQPPTDKTRKDVLQSQLNGALSGLNQIVSDIKALNGGK